MSENPHHHPNAMISSTIRDLPDHRDQAKDACLRTSFFSVMMEQSPASPRDAVTESLRLVESAPVYIGIYAHRYGFVPDDDGVMNYTKRPGPHVIGMETVPPDALRLNIHCWEECREYGD